MEQKQYSLREKKFARTKVALMREVIRRMEHTRFDAISIREVCEAAEVSEGTFFNYFPQKIDVLYYFMQIHSVKVIWDTVRRSKSDSAIAFIEEMFQCLFKGFDNPNVVYEMIAALVGQKQDPVEIEISGLEKRYAFPDCAGIEDVALPSVMMENVFKEYLVKAVKNGELPEKTDIPEVVMSLKAAMVGIPLALKIKNFQYTAEHYQRHLKLLWTGTRQTYK